jgi:hypothetical protein
MRSALHFRPPVNSVGDDRIPAVCIRQSWKGADNPSNGVITNTDVISIGKHTKALPFSRAAGPWLSMK